MPKHPFAINRLSALLDENVTSHCIALLIPAYQSIQQAHFISKGYQPSFWTNHTHAFYGNTTKPCVTC